MVYRNQYGLFAKPQSKRMARLACALLFACSAYPMSYSHADNREGELSILLSIDGIPCCEGILRVALYNNKNNWLKQKGLIRGRIVVPQQSTQVVELHGLPRGRYAIAIHHDINADGKFNRKFFILPREPYAFSNNVGKYGPPSFEKASFPLQKDEQMSVTMLNTGGAEKDD